MRRKKVLGLPAQPLVQRFPDAYDRMQSMAERRCGLLLHDPIGVPEVPPPFRMAHDDIAAADVGQHPSGNLAGKRALVFPMKVLRAEQEGKSP